MWRAGATDREVGRAFGLSNQSAFTWRKQWGVPPGSQPAIPSRKATPRDLVLDYTAHLEDGARPFDAHGKMADDYGYEHGSLSRQDQHYGVAA